MRMQSSDWLFTQYRVSCTSGYPLLNVQALSLMYHNLRKTGVELLYIGGAK